MTWSAACIPVAVGPDDDCVLDGLRSPLSMPRHPARAAQAARRVRRVFDVGAHRDAPDGACGFGRAPPSGTASKRQALPASCAGEAFVLSQVNPELVV